MKTCSKCNEAKGLAEFNRNKRNKDGRESACRVCARARALQWRQANREKIAGYNKKYLQANHEARAEYKRQCRQANPEKMAEYRQANREKRAEYSRQYYQANREARAEYKRQYLQTPEGKEGRRASQQKRRALKLGAAGKASVADIRARFDYHGNRCYYCGCDGKMTIEHRIPLARGGANWPANIVPACGPCNSSKHTRTEVEFVSQVLAEKGVNLNAKKGSKER
jgi:5-methylcytosine-specific restriction endonuclease McrA